MKKIMIGTTVAASLLLISTLSANAAEYPVTAKSSADLFIKADDSGEGEGPIVDPGGDGEIEVPDPGEDGDGGIVNPGQKTPLRISLLTAFNFGEITMSGNTKEYNALLPQVTLKPSGTKADRPNFVQVTDNRGSNAGWNLTAKISDQFTNGTSTLTGSTITLDNGWATPQEAELAQYAPTVSKPVVLSEEDSQLIATAAKDNGMGTWNIFYGALDGIGQASNGDAKESVTLEVPGKVKKTEGAYKAKVEWTLADTPSK